MARPDRAIQQASVREPMNRHQTMQSNSPSFGLALENSFSRLPGEFYTQMPAERVGASPRLIHANAAAAKLIDLDPAVFADPQFTATVSGHQPLAGFAPLAMVYAGHQFGVWAGQLGD